MLKKNLLFFNFFLYYITIFVNGIDKNNQPVAEYYLFNNIQYIFFSQQVTWEEANILCLTYNAKLAVLDDMPKAITVAEAMAESNIAMEDVWLGGRRFDNIWIWIDNNSSSKQYKIPLKSNIDDFPPWSREPIRLKKECLAIDRRSHSHPNFIDLDCRLLRPFICEKNSENSIDNPLPSKWVQIQKNIYTLYHGKLTWSEAVTFCRSQGTRLAVIKNQNIINILTHYMIKSRPDFESVWIGARFSYGQWIWISTGSTLNTVSDETGYPPWRFGKPEKNTGCLLLDIHLENIPNFIEILCDRKRDFICEEYPQAELEEWMSEPIKFTYENISFAIYPFEKTWDESRLYCQEKGSFLAYIDSLLLANTMIAAMGDHPKEISHVWLGGFYQLNKTGWKWIHNNQFIPQKYNNSNFPVWSQNILEDDYFQEEPLCLNLDRIDHTKPHFYGLNCESKQAFACLINCDMPISIKHGNWNCNNNINIKSCILECESGFFTMGLQNLYCNFDIGWYNKENWLELPLCLGIKDYINRMIRSFNEDLQKSSGYYVLLSHFNEKFQDYSLKFVKKLLSLISTNNNLKMGMTSYISNSKSNIVYEQSDTCTFLKLISSMYTKVTQKMQNESNARTINYTTWANDILKNNGHRTVIIAIIDSISARQNKEIFEELRTLGHYVITIGLKSDWESLLPISTIGFDKRLNLYLFNEEEFEIIINELEKIKSKPLKCLQQTLLSYLSATSSEPQTISTNEYKILNETIIDTTTEVTNKLNVLSTQEFVNNLPVINITSTTQIMIEEEINLKKNEELIKNKKTAEDERYRKIYMDKENN